MKLIKNFQEFNLNEGLLRSYPIEDIMAYVNRKGIEEEYYRGGSDEFKLDIVVKYHGVYNQLVNTIINMFGWYAYGYYEDFEGRTTDKEMVDTMIEDVDWGVGEAIKDGAEEDYGICTLIFKPRKLHKVEEIPSKLYTLIDNSQLNKVKEKGLFPKKTKYSTYETRIIFVSDISKMEDIMDKDYYEYEFDEPVIVSIDVSLIDVEVFKDKEIETGYYTTEPVSPRAIKNLGLF